MVLLGRTVGVRVDIAVARGVLVGKIACVDVLLGVAKVGVGVALGRTFPSVCCGVRWPGITLADVGDGTPVTVLVLV